MSKVLSNVEKYQEIYNKKKSNPALSLAKLCEEANTTYQSYNNWVKKHHRNGGSKASGQALRITIQVSLEELANLVAGGGKSLSVRVEDILKGIPPQDMKQLAGHLGMMRLERLQSGSQPAKKDQPQPHGDGSEAVEVET
jgi:hypothetical protein